VLLIVGEAIVAYQRDIGADGAGRTQGFSGPWASGSPAIAAYVAARLGVPTSFIGGIGRDDHGRVMYDGLAAAGVRLDHLRVVEDAPTASAYITYRGEASREFDFHVVDSAATRVTPQDLGHLPEQARWMHMSGSALIFGEPLASATLSALDRAYRAGARISVDPNVRPEALGPEARETLVKAISLAHVVLPSEGELDALGVSVDALVAAGTTVCTTRGPLGVVVQDRDGTTHVEAVPVVPVDTDGAGDSFAAGFIAASLAGAAPRSAARVGAMVAAQAILTAGPMTVVPDQSVLAGHL
jgi:sugar/nucleoside kinase (ribokinase family)